MAQTGAVTRSVTGGGGGVEGEAGVAVSRFDAEGTCAEAAAQVLLKQAEAETEAAELREREGKREEGGNRGKKREGEREGGAVTVRLKEEGKSFAPARAAHVSFRTHLASLHLISSKSWLQRWTLYAALQRN